jgi:lysylphosphatidylglycerol synthetase-like protein (DUF2156 family)
VFPSGTSARLDVMVPDEVELEIVLGGRMLVAGNLLLRASSTASSEVAAAELAGVLETWDGPGAVVLLGGTFDLLGDERTTVAAALTAHPLLTAALRRFAARPGCRLVAVPGAADTRLAWDAEAQRAVTDQLGATVALAVDAEAMTGAGVRRLRLEPGARFDPAFAPVDVRSPADRPFGAHLVGDVVPSLTSAFGAGGDRLDSLSSLPRFAASRLLYRRAAPWAWLVLVPFVLAMLANVPLSFALSGPLDRALGSWSHRLLLVGAVTSVAFVMTVLVAAAVVARTWRALTHDTAAGSTGTTGTTGATTDPNAAARTEARARFRDGITGLVTAHTRSPELTGMGTGFYANVGALGDVTVERRARLGLPAVFVRERVTSWLELEAGAQLHVRLFHGAVLGHDLSMAERLALRRTPRSPRPVLVATYPGGSSWPEATAPIELRTRVRRRAGVAVAVGGLLNVISATTPPLELRLHSLLRWVPLAVPQSATALVAMSGVGLLALGRGVRRGQRDAWRVALALLGGSVVLHLVKGVDVEEAAIAGAAAAYLLAHRRSFTTARSTVAWPRTALTATAAAVGLVAAVTVAIEVVTAAKGVRLGLPDALAAALGRLVGLRSVALPHRLDEFASPTLLAVGIACAAWLAFAAVRPARGRLTSSDERERARSLIATWGSGTLDYFALRSDKQLFFSGDTVVAYAVHHGVCLVSPDPIGPPWETDVAWHAFRSFADGHGWSVAVLGAGEERLAAYRASGMHDLYVGDEAVVDTTRFSLDGGRHKSLRQAVNRVAKYGYTISFHDPSSIAPELREQLGAVMGKSRRGDVERGFSMTLGRVFDAADRGLLLAVCHGPAGEPVAFCQYVPIHEEGYSLDLMRRDSGEHPNGLLDFVVVETIRHLQSHGVRTLGLNFATMRAVLAGETGGGLAVGVERWVLRRLSGSMQIESLWRFNAKFDPQWRARYLVFDTPEHLVPIAFAVARAESFWELPVIGRFLTPPREPVPQ